MMQQEASLAEVLETAPNVCCAPDLHPENCLSVSRKVASRCTHEIFCLDPHVRCGLRPVRQGLREEHSLRRPCALRPDIPGIMICNVAYHILQLVFG